MAVMVTMLVGLMTNVMSQFWIHIQVTTCDPFKQIHAPNDSGQLKLAICHMSALKGFEPGFSTKPPKKFCLVSLWLSSLCFALLLHVSLMHLIRVEVRHLSWEPYICITSLCQRVSSFPVIDTWFFWPLLYDQIPLDLVIKIDWFQPKPLSSGRKSCPAQAGFFAPTKNWQKKSLFVFAAGLTLVRFYAGQQHLEARRPWPTLNTQHFFSAKILRMPIFQEHERCHYYW